MGLMVELVNPHGFSRKSPVQIPVWVLFWPYLHMVWLATDQPPSLWCTMYLYRSAPSLWCTMCFYRAYINLGRLHTKNVFADEGRSLDTTPQNEHE
jgi:hypothetical protein